MERDKYDQHVQSVQSYHSVQRYHSDQRDHNDQKVQSDHIEHPCTKLKSDIYLMLKDPFLEFHVFPNAISIFKGNISQAFEILHFI